MMTIPLLTWTGIATAMLLLIAFRLYRAARRCMKPGNHILEVAQEREEFWIPGDQPISDDDEYDEFEDL